MDFLQELPDIVTSIGEMFATLFQSVSALFYTPASGTGESAVPGHLTFVGVIAFITLVVGLMLLIINWIKSLIKAKN